MFYLKGGAAFEAGEKGEDVVENLLGGHAEFSVARGDFQPACSVAVIALGEDFAVDEDEIRIIREVHKSMIAVAVGA